jgi:plastocyanin
MRFLKFLLTVTVLLAFAAPAQAAVTKTVTIKKTGFAPAKVTVASGDSVKWTNTDTVDRQIVATGGQFASPVIKPGGSWTRVFATAGTFRYRDVFKPSQTGSVVVTGPPPSVSLAAAAPSVTYGDSLALGGKVTETKAGEQVVVYSKRYGDVSYVQLATVLTADGGMWSYTVTPDLLTTYQVQWKNLKSAEIQIAVEPKVTLKRIGAWFVVRVDAARSFKNRWVYVQRRSSLGQWVNVKKVIIGTSKSQRFKIRVLPSGLSHLRLFMTVNQAGVGYLATESNTLLVRRR